MHFFILYALEYKANIIEMKTLVCTHTSFHCTMCEHCFIILCMHYFILYCAYIVLSYNAHNVLLYYACIVLLQLYRDQ